MNPTSTNIAQRGGRVYRGVFTNYKEYFTREQLEYIWVRDESSIPYGIIDWLDKNTQGAWGWWFVDDHSYVGFESAADCFEAKLHWS